MMQHWSMFAI
uniref:Uncharacterized protein n=1 Tax=Romanomermis culicivorax TaxID=13658 RepID=A0A915J7S6_ROMCU